VSRGIRDAFPGFKRAVYIFAAYVVVDFVYGLATTPRRASLRDHEVAQWERDGLAENPRHKKDSHH